MSILGRSPGKPSSKALLGVRGRPIQALARCLFSLSSAACQQHGATGPAATRQPSCSPPWCHCIEHRIGWTIKKFVRAGHCYRTVHIRVGRRTLTATYALSDDPARSARQDQRRECKLKSPKSSFRARGVSPGLPAPRLWSRADLACAKHCGNFTHLINAL
jgi:hypothetical protein